MPPYATVSHVETETPARAPYTASTVPNAQQVAQYVIDASAKADLLLTTNGYDIPVSTTATVAYAIVRQMVSQIAAYDVERNAPTNGDDLDYYKEMAEHACKMLSSSRLPGLERTRDISRARYGPLQCATPFFTLGMGL